MRNYLIVVLTMLSSICFSQRPNNYTPLGSTAYEWTQPGAFSKGLGLPAKAGAPDWYPLQWKREGSIQVDSTAHKTYIYYSTTGWTELGAGAITIPGNYGNILINRNNVPQIMGGDSATIDASGNLLLKGSAKIGNQVGTSTSALTVRYPNSNKKGINSGPDNYNFPGYNNNFVTIDSGITSNSSLAGYGTNINRIWFIQPSVNPALTFKFGHHNGLAIALPDSFNWNPQNHDGAAAVINELGFGKGSLYTGHSRVFTGAAVDAVSVTLSQAGIYTTSSGNHTRIIGGVNGVTSYFISETGSLLDTVDNYHAFESTAAAFLTPRFSKWVDYYGGGCGGCNVFSTHTDSAWFLQQALQSGSIPFRNVLNGPTSIAIDGVSHSGPVEALEVYGSPKFVDGNQSNGYVWTSDANGKGHWAAATGGSGMNTDASNAASTAVSADWLPGTDDTYTLGSATKQWKELNLGNTRKINWDNGGATIGYDATSGAMQFSANGSGGDAYYQFYRTGRTSYIQLIHNGGTEGLMLMSSSGGFPTIKTLGGTGMQILTASEILSIGGTLAEVSAKVDIQSTTKGFLKPRMTTTQMNAIASPATGLEISNSTTTQPMRYDGTAWRSSAPITGSFSGAGTATTVFTVTFGGTQPNSTYKVNVTPTASLSAAVFYVTNKTTTTFDVTYLAGLTGTVTFDWSLNQ